MNIIECSEDIEEDLSGLKNDRFCVVLMGDTRQKGGMVPRSFGVRRGFG